MERPAKKQKFDAKAKKHFAKQAHFKKNSAFLDVGAKGYLVKIIFNPFNALIDFFLMKIFSIKKIYNI